VKLYYFLGFFGFFFDSILVPVDDVGLNWTPGGIYLVSYYGGPFLGSVLLILSGVILVLTFLLFKVGLTFYYYTYWVVEIFGFFFYSGSIIWVFLF